MRSGRITLDGTHVLKSPLEFDRFTGILQGNGACAEDADAGTCLVAALDDPERAALELTQCWGAQARDLRIKSRKAGRAGIYLRSEKPHSPVNTGNRFENLWIGHYPGDECAALLEYGFLVGGEDFQGDQSSISNLCVQGVRRSALAFLRPQQVLWDLNNVRPNDCLFGIETATRHMVVTNYYPQTCRRADIYMPGDAQIRITGCGSELSGGMFLADDGFDAAWDTGYYQCDPRSTDPSGRIIQAVSSCDGSLSLRNYNISTRGSFEGKPPLRLCMRVRKHGVLTLDQVSIPVPIDTFLDCYPRATGETRCITLRNVRDPNGIYSGEFHLRYGRADPTFSVDCERA